jgi:site-specific DNA-methyltransferase (adenine-specific)
MTLEINRIYCGDCLDLMKEMPDKSVDLVLTDPPYGIGEANGKNESRDGYGLAKATHYGYLDWDDNPPTMEYFNEIFRISKNQIIFGGNYFGLPATSCYIVWDKDNTGNFADAELAWTSFPTAVRIFKWRWNGLLQEDMSHKEKRVHPTQKPLKLMEWCLQKYSKPGDLVLDPFLGSGTTAVACKKLGRNYIGIEKEQAYVDIALKRLEKVNNHKITDFFGVAVVVAVVVGGR